ncbi:HEPN domain-containing protein [Mucilaginibacter sp. L3T2-6]|uniref:HEPN domain-containing protein n=1 Tax=Mucilaginibacter sp. L3T2-6 TaxID=3062491 RepID=UPI0026775138|nr:HEPN domain-containing protein [Mucilaginibacter sp. L3T2-6]MDO3641353.1 HEPN domain-containing protein [Mucilaginibacter sp. L3T2-6]MDV6213886.1 HEPN domain-containing protein [Mucilaginibacter sp. L3T2-6]
MLKYNLKYSLADAARLFKVDKDIVKKWCYYFSEYLSKNANPTKGTPREFNLEDIRIFGYILQYWEDEPDFENIKYGLNSNSHHDDFLIDEFILLNTPFVIEPPEDIDESWKHGILFVGLSEFADTFFLAKSYKLAGDRLIEASLENEERLNLYPAAIFNYRHAVELYIKAVLGSHLQTHNLLTLLEKLKDYLKKEFNASLPEWLGNIVITFHDFDPYGTTLRYGGNPTMEEVFINFNHLKSLMERLAQAFQNIRFHQGLPDGI